MTDQRAVFSGLGLAALMALGCVGAFCMNWTEVLRSAGLFCGVLWLARRDLRTSAAADMGQSRLRTLGGSYVGGLVLLYLSTRYSAGQCGGAARVLGAAPDVVQSALMAAVAAAIAAACVAALARQRVVLRSIPTGVDVALLLAVGIAIVTFVAGAVVGGGDEGDTVWAGVASAIYLAVAWVAARAYWRWSLLAEGGYRRLRKLYVWALMVLGAMTAIGALRVAWFIHLQSVGSVQLATGDAQAALATYRDLRRMDQTLWLSRLDDSWLADFAATQLLSQKDAAASVTIDEIRTSHLGMPDEARAAVGSVFARAGRWLAAEREFAGIASPTVWRSIYDEYAESLLKQGAVKVLTDLIARAGTPPDIADLSDDDRFNLGVALTLSGLPRSGRPLLGEHLRSAAESVEALYWHGYALNRVGRSSEAADILNRAAQMDPESGAIRRELGIASEANGNLAEAEEGLRGAIQVTPDDIYAKCRLARLLWRRGREAEAGDLSAQLKVTIPARELYRDLQNAGTEDGWLCWDGHARTRMSLCQGVVSLTVVARGTTTVGEWARMQVLVDRQQVGMYEVTSTEWRGYTSRSHVDDGSALVEIGFLNDGVSNRGEDRNLMLQSVTVSYDSLDWQGGP